MWRSWKGEGLEGKGVEGEGRDGMGWGGSHTQHIYKAEEINILKLLIFVVSSRDPHYVCFC